MSESGTTHGKFNILKGAALVLAFATDCSLFGGGWHFLNPHDELLYGLYYKTQSADEIAFADRKTFLLGGPAAAVVGALVASASLALRWFFVRRNS